MGGSQKVVVEPLQVAAREGIFLREPVIFNSEVQQVLAQIYDEAPHCGELHHARMWSDLGDYALEREAKLAADIDVIVVKEPPYNGPLGAERMFNDIGKGRYLVHDFTTNDLHTYWPCRTWQAFRTVHDLDGHVPSHGDFSAGGEEAVFKMHCERLEPEWHPAVFAETLFELASTLTNHAFPTHHKALITGESMAAMEAILGDYHDRRHV